MASGRAPLLDLQSIALGGRPYYSYLQSTVSPTLNHNMCSTPLDFYLRGRIGANIGDPQNLAIEGTLLIEFPTILI